MIGEAQPAGPGGRPVNPRVSSLAGIARLARAEQWWSYKLSPMLAIYYATLLRSGMGVAEAGWTGLLLLAGIGACAAYVSLSNDLADRRDDRIAGKPNRLEGKSAPAVAFALAVPLALGAAIAWCWRSDPPALLAFAGSWISFTLYSFEPLRLKARGIWGIMADALGAHGLPALLAALLAFDAAGRPPDLAWCVCVATWSGAFGLRGILWHQLLDAEADRRSATGTFVQRHGAAASRKIVGHGLFPIELALLLTLLWLVPGRGSMFALALYGLYVVGTMVRLEIRPTLVVAVPRYSLLLVAFYVAIWPLALLLDSAWQHPLDAVVIAVHALLFHRPILELIDTARRVIWR
ncbi:MAG TPA: hypothetical protein VF485_01560 [Sphingomonas sp.]